MRGESVWRGTGVATRRPFASIAARLSGLSLLLVLAGCAAVPQPVPDPAQAQVAFAERSLALAPISHWRFAGRMTLELPTETWSGQLSWRAEGAEQVIDLSGPMGRGGGRLFLGGDRARLITRDGEHFEAADPDALIAQLTGREIPVSGLEYWVRGLARPDVGFDLRADREGRPRRLIQDGWEIGYGAFETVGEIAEAFSMPKSLDLHRADMRLRVSVDRWQLRPQASPPAVSEPAISGPPGLNPTGSGV